MNFRGFLIANLIFALTSAVFGQSSAPPYELAWTVGSCRNCEIVRHLGEIGYTGQETIWAEGYFFPTEGEGAGDYSVIRSNDAGRHWIELARSRMHAGEPSLWFSDEKTGWVSGMSPEAETWVLRTRDGGHHWVRISDQLIQNLQFVNANTAVGSEFDVTRNRSLFAQSVDGGHTWKTSVPPGLRLIDTIHFVSSDVGWIAGTSDTAGDLAKSVAVVLRTADGGRHWMPSQLPSENGVAEVHDLFFLDEATGWLITWDINNGGTHLYFTTDGGETWKLHPDSTIQGTGKWLSVVRFLNAKVGFAFNREDEVNAAVDPPATGMIEVAEAGPTDTGKLLYTDDGGRHWQPHPLGAWVYDCARTGGASLVCGAMKGNSNFLMLRVKALATGAGVSVH